MPAVRIGPPGRTAHMSNCGSPIAVHSGSRTELVRHGHIGVLKLSNRPEGFFDRQSEDEFNQVLDLLESSLRLWTPSSPAHRPASSCAITTLQPCMKLRSACASGRPAFPRNGLYQPRASNEPSNGWRKAPSSASPRSTGRPWEVATRSPWPVISGGCRWSVRYRVARDQCRPDARIGRHAALATPGPRSHTDSSLSL